MTAPSRIELPPGGWVGVLDALCELFPKIDRTVWVDRIERGRVLDAARQPIAVDMPYRVGVQLYYFREVVDEIPIPFVESIVHHDADLLVADKPHFLPVMPAGRFVVQTLLARLVKRFGNPDLVPLHRIDRGTAGLVLFSCSPVTRSRYQALFQNGLVRKSYEAIAPALRDVDLPVERTSRLVTGVPFFRMREADGVANSLSRIELLERGERYWRYRLTPVSGRKHQLRVHMAAIGAPILHDDFYPDLLEVPHDDCSRPLQLLARSLEFSDPLTGAPRRFDSARRLLDIADPSLAEKR